MALPAEWRTRLRLDELAIEYDAARQRSHGLAPAGPSRLQG